MANCQLAVSFAVILITAYVTPSVFADNDVIVTSTITDPGNTATTIINPSTVTVTEAIRTTTVISTTVQTVIESILIHGYTTTTAIITVPLMITASPVTITVYESAVCQSDTTGSNYNLNSQVISPDVIKEMDKIAMNLLNEQNYTLGSVEKEAQTFLTQNLTGIIDKVDINLPNRQNTSKENLQINSMNTKKPFVPEKNKEKNKFELNHPVIGKPQSQNIGVVDDQGVRDYPSTQFTSVMEALSLVVADMKVNGTREDLVQRYEEVLKTDGMFKHSPIKLEELEALGVQVLEVLKEGRESELFFERMEKFVGFMETIYLK